MKKKSFILILIFASGFFLRFWGISSVYMRIDDVAVAKTILDVYHGYWVADHIFYYPPLLYYFCAIALRGISLFLSIIFFHKEPTLYPFTLSQALFISRLVSAFFGFLTVPILYLSLKKLYSERVALLGSFLFSLSFIHVIHSHQLVMDVLSTFFVILCFYFSIQIFYSEKVIFYVLAGLSAGLATSAKYNGLFAVFIIITAHFIREKKLSIKSLFNFRLLTGGVFSLIGFFIGHPFSILRLKSFIRGTKLFFNVVHKTEWYLVPIKPEGIIENIKYSRYFQAISNIFSGEGLLFFLLIILGFFGLFIWRKREHILFLSFPVTYFILLIPLLGFSRYRDLTFLSPFYSALPAISIFSLFDKMKIKFFKIAGILVISFVVLAITFIIFTQMYLIWDDDTSQIFYRWLLRNIEEGKYIGNEWFTIPLEDGKTPYRLHTVPYIFRRELPPFENFDLILSSSLCYSHFYKNKKFYSYELSFYERLEKHELIKEFFGREIEYKNPTIKVYNGKNMKRKGLEVMIPQVPYNGSIPREFEILDGSHYGKETKGFFLREGEKIERIFISKKPVNKLYIFFLNPESDGIVEIRNFVKSEKVKIKKGRDSFHVFKPSLSFPFTKYRYSVRIKGLKGLKRTFVRIVQDEKEAGLQFLEIGDIKNALKCFENLKDKNLEIFLYLKKIRGENIPIQEREFDSLLKLYTIKDTDIWKRFFRKITAFDPDLLQESKTIKLQAEESEWKRGSLAESPELSGGKGIFLKEEDKIEIYFPEIFLYKGTYRIKLIFIPMGEMKEINISIFLSQNGYEKHFEVDSSFLRYSEGKALAEIGFEVEKPGPVKLTFYIENGENSILDFVKIYPSIHEIFLQRGNELKEFFRH